MIHFSFIFDNQISQYKLFLVKESLPDKGVINLLAPFGKYCFYFHLFFLKILINSQDLYAAIPPQIISNIFFLSKFFIVELKYYET